MVTFRIIFTFISKLLEFGMNLLKHSSPLLEVLFSITASCSDTALMLLVLNLFKVFFQHLFMLLVFHIWVWSYSVALWIVISAHLIFFCSLNGVIDIFTGLPRKTSIGGYIQSSVRWTFNTLVYALSLVGKVFLDVKDMLYVLDFGGMFLEACYTYKNIRIYLVFCRH